MWHIQEQTSREAQSLEWSNKDFIIKMLNFVVAKVDDMCEYLGNFSSQKLYKMIKLKWQK
jgi:hypothetical protein